MNKQIDEKNIPIGEWSKERTERAINLIKENEKIMDEHEKQESHTTKQGYCCACDYDIACMEEKIKEAEDRKVKEIADKLVQIEKEKWDDAEHCNCLGYAIVTVFGEEYEEKLKNDYKTS